MYQRAYKYSKSIAIKALSIQYHTTSTKQTPVSHNLQYHTTFIITQHHIWHNLQYHTLRFDTIFTITQPPLLHSLHSTSSKPFLFFGVCKRRRRRRLHISFVEYLVYGKRVVVCRSSESFTRVWDFIWNMNLKLWKVRYKLQKYALPSWSPRKCGIWSYLPDTQLYFPITKYLVVLYCKWSKVTNT